MTKRISELIQLEKRKKFLESNVDENFNIEQKYETVRVEVQELSLRSSKTVNSEISFKQRELERSKISFKQLLRDEEELTSDMAVIKDQIKQKDESLAKKKALDEELNKKFKRLVADRDSLQAKTRQGDADLSLKQNIIYNLEQYTNNFKIDKARVGAEIENFEMEMLEFQDIPVIKTNKDTLLHRLNKAQEILSKIGSVNLR